jgi:hypothetical protein
VVPGGTITVAVRQVSGFSRPLISVDASIALAARTVTATFTEFPAETLVVGPPIALTCTGLVPRRSIKMRPTAWFPFGLVTVQYFAGPVVLAEYDSGTDRVLFQTGIPIPSGSIEWYISRTNGPVPLALVWEIQ